MQMGFINALPPKLVSLDKKNLTRAECREALTDFFKFVDTPVAAH
jgi:hypothetical protein